MMYLGDKAIGINNNYSKKLLLYENNTFGNVWTEYQPIDIDYENNALVLSNANGLPTEITNNGTAYIQLKPYTNVQYGGIPVEYYKTACLKSIGNNKVELYNSQKQLLIPTETAVLDLTNFVLLYRSSTNITESPTMMGLPSGHQINVKLYYNGIFGGACGIQLLDSDGAMIRGTGYDQSTSNFRMTGFLNRPDNTLYALENYDSYGCIAGNRALTFPLGDLMKNGWGYFDVTLIPDLANNIYFSNINGLHMAVNTKKETNWFVPCTSYTSGYITKAISGIKASTNSINIEWYGPNSKVEIWDCGPVN